MTTLSQAKMPSLKDKLKAQDKKETIVEKVVKIIKKKKK